MTIEEYLKLIKYEERRLKPYGTPGALTDEEIHEIMKYILAGAKVK